MQIWLLYIAIGTSEKTLRPNYTKGRLFRESDVFFPLKGNKKGKFALA